MKRMKLYEADDKMIDLISDNYSMLHPFGVWRQDRQRNMQRTEGGLLHLPDGGQLPHQWLCPQGDG